MAATKRIPIPGLSFLSGNILVFAITDLLGNFARGAVFTYAPLYVLALGGDAAKVGWVGFASLAAGLFMLPIAGHITDYVDRIRLLVVAGLLSSLFLLLFIFAPGWQVLALASLLAGTVVFQFPAYASLIADSLLPRDRGRGIGAMNTVSSSLAVIAPYLAGLIIERYSANLGMRILYAVMLFSYLLSTLIQSRYLRENSPIPREPLRLAALTRALREAYGSVPDLYRQMTAPLKALALVVLLSFIANGVASAFWVVYAIEQIGLTAAEWGLIRLIESIVGLATFYPAGLLVDRWGRKNTLLAALVLSLIAQPLFVVLRGFFPVLILRVVIALAFTLAIPASMALMADLMPRRLRGQMMAAVGQGGIMIGPAGGGIGGPALGYLFIPPTMLASLAGGYLYLLNPAYPWLITLAAMLLSIFLAILFIREPQHAEI